ncbi:hypothetical protein A3L14_07085 [Thermococcus thioreducens]|uniref:Uncharacterized protein n=1 Tax=Thermococcus thioreducens TaxID=277988 RepID=A0A0Q2XLF7_9EURY|nr:hypothetical protein A3L14_07085 [Thermococcus thioreducens]KQH81996.1 hypothetical protein AMR53_07860 [Thermococcus thioreducens]
MCRKFDVGMISFTQLVFVKRSRFAVVEVFFFIFIINYHLRENFLKAGLLLQNGKLSEVIE